MATIQRLIAYRRRRRRCLAKRPDPLPLSGSNRQTAISAEGVAGVDEGGLRTDQANVTPGYFRLMGIPLIAGETFSGREAEDNPVVVIDETLAAHLFPQGSAIGKRLKLRGTDRPWMTVIGVVGHVKHYGVNAGSRVQLYMPYTQLVYSLNLLVDANGNNSALAAMVRTALAEIDPNVPLSNIRTMDELEAATIANETLVTQTLVAFGGVALSMALLGVYGVVSFSVSRRTREIGIRRALGARSERLVGRVLREALMLAAIGVVVGSALTMAASRLLGNMLYEVAPMDGAALGAAAALMMLIAGAAALVPARRAAAVEPTIALRSE